MTKSHHSEDFINDMKKALEAEKGQLEQKLNTLGHQEEGGEYQANFPDYGRDDEANATEVADFQATSSTETAMDERLKEVTDALARIEAGTYGITEDGEAIPEDRLRANPAATTLVHPSK